MLLSFLNYLPEHLLILLLTSFLLLPSPFSSLLYLSPFSFLFLFPIFFLFHYQLTYTKIFVHEDVTSPLPQSPLPPPPPLTPNSCENRVRHSVNICEKIDRGCVFNNPVGHKDGGQRRAVHNLLSPSTKHDLGFEFWSSGLAAGAFTR